MNILINQPAGLGDILFCQKIAKVLISEGHTVFWPVLPSLSYISDYIKVDNLHFEGCPVIDKIIDLQNADRIYGGCVIRAKYKLAGLDHSDWADYLSFGRDQTAKMRLKEIVCPFKDYAFVNRHYGTPPDYAIKNFSFETDLPIVETQFVKGFTPFDWCGIIENASEIYTVDTSFMILMEKLKLQSKSNNVWSRVGHFTHVEGLFRQPWNLQSI